MAELPKFYRATCKILTFLGKSGSVGKICLFWKKIAVLVNTGNPGPGAGARPGDGLQNTITENQ